MDNVHEYKHHKPKNIIPAGYQIKRPSEVSSTGWLSDELNDWIGQLREKFALKSATTKPDEYWEGYAEAIDDLERFLKRKSDNALFALFGGEAYYPGGGWYDLKGTFPSPDDARQAVKERWDFWHIVNLETQEVIEHHGGTCYCDGCPPDESLP